jgi:hypothetical protein
MSLRLRQVAVCGVVVEAEGVRDDGGWGLEDKLAERGNAAGGAGKACAGDEFEDGRVQIQLPVGSARPRPSCRC